MNPAQSKPGRREIDGIGLFYPECLTFAVALDVLGTTECCLILESTGTGIFSFVSALILLFSLVEEINALFMSLSA